MKSKRSVIVIVSIIALIIVAVLIARSGDSEFAREVSRFAQLGPEGELSNAEVQQILQQSTSGPVVITALKNDETPPLKTMPVIKPTQSKPDPDLNELRLIGSRANGPKAKPPANAPLIDPALQSSDAITSLSIPSPLQNFDGVTNVNGVLPPDTNGDVGPNNYVQWVNLSFAIYSKTGTLLYGPAAGNTLWAGFGAPCQTSNDGDPIVQYDHLADRWMMSQFALPNYPSGPFYQCIAISQTGDPTGAWYRYAFQISATKMNDYPHLGVWPDGYYMSINQFVGNTWAGAGAVAFERSKMLLGQPAQAVYFDLYSVDPNMGGMLPSDLDGQAPPAGTPNYFMEADDNAFGFPQDQLNMWQFSVNWTTPSASTFTQVSTMATAAFDSDMCAGSRNCIAQQGTTRKLDAISDRLMYRLQYRNFGGYQTIVLNHTVDVNSADHAGIRWYELRNSGGGWSIYQQGTFSPDATQRWMGSAAMDANGNIAIGYSASSSTMYPAIRYTGRLAGDTLGTMSQGEGTLFAGTGAQTHSASRWGDYSMLAVDPVDGCTFWYTNEYVQTTGSAPWRTRIGSFQLPGCGGPTTGTLQGTVTDASTSAALSGATVTIAGGASTTTNGSGFYQFTNVAPGTYSVTASATGHNSNTANGVSVTSGNTTTQNFALTASGPTTGTLQGTVTDASTSAAINGATVAIVGGASTTTNSSGFYQFTNVTPGTYNVTAAKTGYNTGTNSGVSVTAGNTTTSNFALTQVTGPANTGLLNPSANAAQTGGDNNGYQTNPTNAYNDNSVFTVDTNSGSNSNSSCTNSGKDKHLFYNYGITIPGTTILGIEVRLDARVDSTSGAAHLCIQLSWNSGSSWTSAQQTGNLTTSEQTYVLGGPSNTWGHTWTLSQLSNANFRVRIIDVASNTSRDFSLDWIAVRVTYQ